MSRKPVVGANWKMFKTPREGVELAQDVVSALGADAEAVEVVVCPPFPALVPVSEVLQGTALGLGAQNAYWEAEGAFTGEVSVPMLQAAGCGYVIIGHSERRHKLGESDEDAGKKVQAVLAGGLQPILCVGELLEEREAGQTEKVVARHLETGLALSRDENLENVVVAYEPVWAIGTGKAATKEDANEVCVFIRQWLKDQLGAQVAEAVRIQYGGSVKPENAADYMAQSDIDGALVGGASLKPNDFAGIVAACRG